jgi:hypothetical protein
MGGACSYVFPTFTKNYFGYEAIVTFAQTTSLVKYLYHVLVILLFIFNTHDDISFGYYDSYGYFKMCNVM